MRLQGGTLHLPDIVPAPVPGSEVDISHDVGRELILADESPLERAKILTRASRSVRRPDPAIYSGDALYPAAPARLGRTGVLRDQRYVEVFVSPIQWDPAIGGLRLHSGMELTVHFVDYPRPDGQAREERIFESVYREVLANPVQGRSYRLSAYRAGRVADDSTAPAETAKGATPRARIVTREDGMVLLDHDRLQSIPGLLATEVGQWRLTRSGATVPFEIHDDGNGLIEPGEWIRFFGQAYDDDPKTVLNTDFPDPFKDLFAAGDFTDETTYFLTVEPVAQPGIETIDGTPVGATPEEWFLDIVRMEVNDAYRPLGGADPWYWLPTLVVTGENPPTRLQPMAVPGLFDASAPIEATVHMRGTSSNDNLDPDHPTRFRIRTSGGLVLASQDGAFDGRTLYTHDLTWNYGGSGPVATDPLLLELEVLPTGGGRNDVIPDFFEVRYRRSFDAIDDVLLIRWPDGPAEFLIDELSTQNVDVFDVTPDADTGQARVRRVTGAEIGGTGPYQVRFRIDDDPALAPGTVRELIVVADGLGTVPADEDFQPDTVSDLRNTALQADLIVLGHDDLIDDSPASVLDQLLAFKASPAGGSLASSVARLQDVYDEFNGGQPGPGGIREFLRWVLSDEPGEGWADPKPSYVLILGDGSVDYKGPLENGNFVPTQILFKEDPQLGYYSSDNLMAAVVGDDPMPDMIIGRIPSRSLEQVESVLQKTLDYQATPDTDGVWRRHSLLISDRGTSSGEGNLDFELTNARAQSLICSSGESTFPTACPGDTMFTSKHLRYYTDYYSNPAVFNPPFKMSVDIKAAVNGEDGVADGVSILQYGGHGNFVVWSGDAYFDQRPPTEPDVRDTEELFNGQKLPFLMAHNCLTGGFHITPPNSMGEDWLHRVGGGAIAVFSPSGLSYNYVGQTVTDVVWSSLFGRHKERRVGVLAMQVLTQLCLDGSIEPCQHYILQGDPSVDLNVRSVEPATGLTAVASNRQVDLSWGASSSPGVTYDLYRKREFFLYEKINDAPLTETSYSDTGLTNAQPYLYFVVAVDADGFESRWSNFNEDCSTENPDCVRATPLNPDPPGTPTGLTVSDPGLGNRLDFRWDANPEDDLAYYTVHYGTEPGVFTTVQNVGLLTALSVSGVPEGQPIHFAVSATNTSSRESDVSEPVSDFPIFAPGVRPPAYIGGLRVDKSASDLLLEWDEVIQDSYGKATNVILYEILRGSGYTNDALAKVGECTAPCDSFLDPGAADLAGPVQYRVRAVDAVGLAGGLGAEFPRGTTLSVVVSEVTPGNIVLSWNPVTETVAGQPAVGIHYRVLAANRPFTLEAARSGTVNVLLVTDQTSIEITPEPQSRYYSVMAVDARGNVSPF